MSDNFRIRTSATDPEQGFDIERLGRDPFDGKAVTGAACLAAANAAHRDGRLPRRLPEDAARALALVLTEPKDALLDRIRSGLTLSTTQSADVTTLRATSAVPLILPGEQPRGASSGGRPLQVDEPVDVSQAGSAGDLRTLRFHDLAHLRAWVIDAIDRSLTGARNTDKAREIVATGVRRPLVVAPTLIEFDDGTPSQWVAMAHDGITRLSLCLAALYDVDELDTAEAAAAIGSNLVPARLSDNARDNALLRAGRRQYDRLVFRYRASLLDGADPNEDGVWVRQHLHVPIDLHLAATAPGSDAPAPLHHSMVNVVADAHTGVTSWDRPDERLHSVQRAIGLLGERGSIPDSLIDLMFRPGDEDDAPGLLLRRAVDIVAYFFSAEMYAATKTALREVTSRKSLKPTHVMAYLAPLMCQPWGAAKSTAEAWNYGGVALEKIVGGTFTPIHPESYLRLVDQALHGDEHDAEAARLELAVAGGIALIVDGLLPTTLVGGAGGSTDELAFRGKINDAIEGLTRTEEGLTALALAADNFEPRTRPDTARHPQVDLAAVDRIARDGMGRSIDMTLPIIARYAAEGHEDRSEAATGPSAVPVAVARLDHLVAHLPEDVHAVAMKFEEILFLLAEDDTSSTSGLTLEDRDAIAEDLGAAFTALSRIR